MTQKREEKEKGCVLDVSLAQKEGIEPVLDCIDRALLVFGKDFGQIIYWQFAKSSGGMKRRDILKEPKEFVFFLEKTFGKGAKIIEREIVSEIGLEYNLSILDPFDVVEAINHAACHVLIA